jgi:aminoglycoside N3'-acetyltransferase
MLSAYLLLLGGANVTETNINITEKLQKIGQTAQDYKDAIVNQFKDMEVDVKDWNFSVGKAEKEYTVEVNIKLAIRPKKV